MPCWRVQAGFELTTLLLWVRCSTAGYWLKLLGCLMHVVMCCMLNMRHIEWVSGLRLLYSLGFDVVWVEKLVRDSQLLPKLLQQILKDKVLLGWHFIAEMIALNILLYHANHCFLLTDIPVIQCSSQLPWLGEPHRVDHLRQCLAAGYRLQQMSARYWHQIREFCHLAYISAKCQAWENIIQWNLAIKTTHGTVRMLS